MKWPTTEQINSSVVVLVVVTVGGFLGNQYLGGSRIANWFHIKPESKDLYQVPGLIVFAIATGVLATAVSFGYRRGKRVFYRWRVASWTGIARVFPVRPYKPGAKTNEDERASSEKALQQLVSTTNRVDLLLVSGWYYIGCLRYPGVLYNALSKRKDMQLRVLLLSPDSKIMVERANEAKMAVENYAAGVHAVVHTLATWKRQLGADISVWFYHEAPIWQLVMTEKETWLLCATSVVTNDSPIYCINRNADYSIAFGMTAVWQRRLDSAIPVDLDHAPEPDWSKIKDRSAAAAL